jgi:hypothetical protein
MRLSKILPRLAAAFALLLLACAFALWVRPPDLLRVGANYSAKIVCSNVFLAARDPDEVLRTDVQAPGVGLLRLMRVSVDRQRRVVRASLFGFIGDGLAIERPGNGCTVVPDGNLGIARRVRLGSAPGDRAPAAVAPGSADGAADWPLGNAVATDAALDRLLADDTLAGPGIRAIVVVHHGRIVAERYAAGFSAATPLLGWCRTWRPSRARNHWRILPASFGAIRAGRPTSCHASCKTLRAGSVQSIRPKSSSGRSA